MSQSNARLLRLVETAIMIALAVALSYVKLFKMPQGGSVTLGSMVPIMLIALRHGAGWGVATGAIAGLIQYMLEPYFVHPVQFLLDYPLAFAALGLAGLAHGRPFMAAAWLGPVALLGRFVAHVISGAVFFAEYAPAGQSPWVYSMIYNGSYMLPELVISGVLLMLLLPTLERALPSRVRSLNG
ncbi:MAG: energy-coupled thiamine transporter ThiT [Bacillota bacterium]